MVEGDTLVEHALGNGALALAQREREELVPDPAQLGLRLQHHHWVHARGEHLR